MCSKITVCASVAALLTVAVWAAYPDLATLRKHAEQGDAVAQNDLGSLYYAGIGVPQDYAEAIKWNRLAAEQGLAAAQCYLGFAYDKALGVVQDHAEAVKWYRKAVAQGDATAQNCLGFAYDQGLGVPQNHAEGIKWYRMAAAQSNATAQANLGFAYETGQGVPLNYATAVAWYRMAAAQGDANAQIKIGNAYAKGLGVPLDRAEAAKWYRMATAKMPSAKHGQRSKTPSTTIGKPDKENCVPAKELVKHPDNYAGKRIVVYGRVTTAVKGMMETDFIILDGCCRCHFPRGAKIYESLRRMIHSEVFISGTAVGGYHVTANPDIVDCAFTLW